LVKACKCCNSRNSLDTYWLNIPVFENFKWVLLFAIFFGGISCHLSKALLCHLLEIDISWTTTCKEVSFIALHPFYNTNKDLGGRFQLFQRGPEAYKSFLVHISLCYCLFYAYDVLRLCSPLELADQWVDCYLASRNQCGEPLPASNCT
jgi:hypothetical protein